MSQTNQETIAVPSPCIDICELDDDGICIGCYRSIEEIAGWGMLNNTQKLEIIELSNKRREAAK